MSKLVIKAKNEAGKTEIYENDFLPVRKYRDYLELQKQLLDENTSETEGLDLQLNFIASLFEGLTVEQMLDGMTMKQLNEAISNILVVIMGGDIDPKQSPSSQTMQSNDTTVS